ncbi:hypothetical protein [Williamsia soli]|uniref:hypothetical protein n=1 Tax=Williamsia soli TaxID=364929 RepID=UPI001A9D2580|nr:hypothetical protein [Williamsia soli]
MNLRGLFDHLSTTVSAEHVDAIVKGLGHIDRRDPDLSESDRNDCVRGLLTEARVSTPAAVSRRAHEMAIALSPPVCRRHRNYIHHKGWAVLIGADEAERSSTHVADGHPWFIAPGKTEPIRSHARRTMTNEPLAA